MHWLLRLFTRERDPQPRRVDELLEIGDRVELVGRVESLGELHSPLDHEPAVVIRYRGRPTARIDRQTPFADMGTGIEAHQALAFVLRDSSGTALIELDAGVDVGEIHQRLLGTYGAALELDVELVRPGDRVRVQGRVRERTDGGSPHRREAWAAVVVAESVALAE
ncbi:hypothetical protein [Enhygromyxa salina]|uniref:Uncharacterized protein n=1 Tax=Enhygromyxa salina TaxID=215803 RepID=A0A2S9YVG0_9BACT|nr:hypothetical protein [Enhygromyxa salina]PRQ09073.1 hypothetical protein ENSA7_10630 [Enhygromyxa salina]